MKLKQKIDKSLEDIIKSNKKLKNTPTSGISKKSKPIGKVGGQNTKIQKLKQLNQRIQTRSNTPVKNAQGNWITRVRKTVWVEQPLPMPIQQPNRARTQPGRTRWPAQQKYVAPKQTVRAQIPRRGRKNW